MAVPRPGPGRAAPAGPDRAAARGLRPDRDQRGVRRPDARRRPRARVRLGRRSTSTAARSRSATRSARAGRGSSRRCCTSSAAARAATGSRRSASAAAGPSPWRWSGSRPERADRRDARPAARPAARRHAARPDDLDDGHRHLERLVRDRRAALRDLLRCRRRDRQPDDRDGQLEARAGGLAAARPRARRGASIGRGSRAGLADRGRDVRPGRAAAAPGVRGVPGAAGSPLDADRSHPPPVRGRHGRPRPPFPRARPEHHRQVPGDGSRDRGDGGGDRRGDQREHDGLLLRRPGDRGGRGDRAWPAGGESRRESRRRPWGRSSRS